MSVYNNEKVIVDSVNTDRGIQLIVDWLKYIGKEEVNINVRTDCTIIQTKSYVSSDGSNFTLSDAWTNTVTISPNQITVNPIYKWNKKISYIDWSNGYKSRSKGSIGDMLSDFGRNSIYPISNSGYGYKSQNGYVSNTERLMRMYNEKPVYTKGDNISNELCEYIMNIPSVIRDEKINSILKDVK